MDASSYNLKQFKLPNLLEVLPLTNTTSGKKKWAGKEFLVTNSQNFK